MAENAEFLERYRKRSNAETTFEPCRYILKSRDFLSIIPHENNAAFIV